MFIKQLSVINFKNYEQAELSFSEHVNCFVGSNGGGKTNLLDAIYYLSFCKSYFNPIDSQNILHEAPFFVVQGTFHLEDKDEEIYCGQKRGQKKQFKRNKKEYSRLADHIGLLPMVMISPVDTNLISEGSEVRRKFIDSVISQYDRVYLDELIKYNKVLSQRNALLKRFAESGAFDQATLDVWNEQLVDYGTRIHAKRKEFIDQFVPVFQEYYEVVSEGKEQVALEYVSHLNEHDFAGKLQDALRRDRALQYTTVGIHKDDLVFKIGDYPIKKFGSQGQQKSYLIALKLAQYAFIKKIKNLSPILLLDDIHDKLDERRVSRLMELVSSNEFGQVFISDTHMDRIAGLFKNSDVKFSSFLIQKGKVEELSEPQLK